MIHCLLWVCNMDMKELIYNIIVARKTHFIWKYPLMVKLMQINSLWLKIAKKIFAENYFPFNTRQAMMPNAIAKEIYTPFLKVSETRKRIARFFNHCKVLRLLTSWNHCSGLVNIGFTRDLWKLESALTAYLQNELSFRHLEEYLTFTGFESSQPDKIWAYNFSLDTRSAPSNQSSSKLQNLSAEKNNINLYSDKS